LILAKRLGFSIFAPLVLLSISGAAVWAQESPQADPQPRVVRVTGSIQSDDLIEVYVEHLRAWVAAGNDPSKLIPYINGLPLPGNYCDAVHLDRNREGGPASVHFHLRITPQNKERWEDLLGAPTGIRVPVSFSVGLENHSPFDSVFDRGVSLPLVVVDPPYGAIALVVVAGMLIAFVRLARNTNLIRDASPDGTSMGLDAGTLRPYNLGRAQMAFWFLLICSSYIAIWLVTGALDTITGSLLGLMGMSAGTALGEAVIDADKADAKTEKVIALTAQKQAIELGLAEAPSISGAADSLQLEDARMRQFQIGQQLRGLTQTGTVVRSRGFIRDILSGGADYSMHRFQIVVWTIVLGIMFLSSVYNNLTMPEFSATLLGLMGLSSGTYIGFKFPEKK
jgi:hypothetical protein